MPRRQPVERSVDANEEPAQSYLDNFLNRVTEETDLPSELKTALKQLRDLDTQVRRLLGVSHEPALTATFLASTPLKGLSGLFFDAFASQPPWKQTAEALPTARRGRAAKQLYAASMTLVGTPTAQWKSEAAMVFRGINGRTLPPVFAQRDEANTRGGVEFGFTSCTKDKLEALEYAKRAPEEKAILLEINMGMIDRGTTRSVPRLFRDCAEAVRPSLLFCLSRLN